MTVKRKNALFGRYSSCDMLNSALRFLKEGKIEYACEEIVRAIDKAGGYFYDYLVPFVDEIRLGFKRRMEKE